MDIMNVQKDGLLILCEATSKDVRGFERCSGRNSGTRTFFVLGALNFAVNLLPRLDVQ